MNLKKLSSLLFAVALLGSATLSVGALTDAAVQSYEERIAQTRRQMEEAYAAIESIRADSGATLADMQKFDEVIRYNEELVRLEREQLERLEAQIADAENKIALAEEDIATKEEAFRRRMVARYMDEDVDFFQILLTSKSLTEFLSRLERMTAVQRQDKKLIQELEEARSALLLEKERLADAKRLQEERIKTLEQVIEETKALYAAKEAYIRDLYASEEAWKAVYEENAAAEKQLNAELEAYILEQQKKNQSQWVGNYSGDSVLGWPIEAGAYYHISSEQGWRKLDGIDDYHLGIDIACYAGTNIRAANAGTVLKSEYHWSYGYYVLIDHGGGLSTLYAHMSENTVQAGEKVSAGQLVGYCGLTGNTKGYHLHFEVRENGEVVNPRNYITLP